MLTTCLTTLKTAIQKWDTLDADGEKVTKSYQITELQQTWTKMQPATDAHNRDRQKYLALEKSWVTRDWEQRAAATAFGCLAVDAFYAHTKLTKSGMEKYGCKPCLRRWIEDLAMQLLLNPYRSKSLQSKVERQQALFLQKSTFLMSSMIGSMPNSNSRVSANRAALTTLSTGNRVRELHGASPLLGSPEAIIRCTSASSNLDHEPTAYSNFKQERPDFFNTGCGVVKHKQRWCRLCKRKTSNFCFACGFDVPICNHEECIQKHRKSTTWRYKGARQSARKKIKRNDRRLKNMAKKRRRVR